MTTAAVALVPATSPAPVSAAPLRALLAALRARFLGPDQAHYLRALALADVCAVPTNVLAVGLPGTGKTAAPLAYAAAVGHDVGAQTLSPWTDDAALLGAVDLKALQAGDLTRVVRPGLLTSATFYIADELPRSGTGTRALLLSALAQRLLPDQHTPVPAHVVVATANTRLVDEDDQALSDRFAQRVDVNDPEGPAFLSVLTMAVPVDGVRRALPPLPRLDPTLLPALRARAADVDLPGDVACALQALGEALRLPAPAGQRHPRVSPRRWVTATRLLQASAVLDDRDTITYDDVLAVLPSVINDGEDTRAAVNAAVAASLPAWVSGLADLRRACDDAVVLAQAVEVDRAPVSPTQSQAHTRREASLQALAHALTEHGPDVARTAATIVVDTLDKIDDLIAEALRAGKAARRVDAANAVTKTRGTY
jgi:MoxR-like ATPase